MLFKSIRFKIILWYVLILSLTLSLFSVVVYQNFSRSLYENLDDLLQSKAEGIVDSINTYWEAEKLEAMQFGADIDVFDKINNINFYKIAKNWVEEKSNDPKLMDIIVQIFNVNGENIASSKDLPELAAFPKETFNSVLKGDRNFNNLKVKFHQGKPHYQLRILTVPVIENGKVTYIVRVASPLITIHSALDNLKLRLLLVLPLIVLLTSMSGAILAKITLHPVDSMINTVRQITADNLELRLEIPDTNDEIKKLAETFNNMLIRLEKSFSFQKQFIQDISHELKTPLTILKGELEVALKRIRSSSEYESVLQSNLEEIDKINRLVENLLILARFDIGAISLEIESIDLNLIVEKTLDDVKVLTQQKNIKINLSAEERIFLEGDKNQIRRLLLNLLDNAIKYTPEMGDINLKLRKKNNSVEIEISDTGTGIPENALPHIFERFYRVDKSRSSYGFGLGLSIAKSIIDAHKGKIEVTSQIGKGTTFIVSLPLIYQK